MLKVNHGRTPLLMVFEILENFRLPFRVVPSRRKKGKGYNRVFLLSWWRQYSQVMKWFRSSCRRTSVRALITWDKQLLTEFELLITNSPNSRLYKRRLAVLQLAVAGRVYSHYRWGNQTQSEWGKRDVKKLYVTDHALAGKTNKYVLGLHAVNVKRDEADDAMILAHDERKKGFPILRAWNRESLLAANRVGFKMEKLQPEPQVVPEVATKQKKKKSYRKRK